MTVATEMHALLTLLDDPEAAPAILARLEEDPSLCARAWAASEACAEPPSELAALVLRQDAEALLDTFSICEDLEVGWGLLARLQRPRTDHAAACAPALDGLAARARAAGVSDGAELATFLCGPCAFIGDRTDYDNPLNSFLPALLERRCGLPIALTSLWLLIARRLGFADCAAITLPGHVVGRWAGGWVDLYAGGSALSREELDLRARLAGGTDAGPWLAAASDRALLRRMARNLTLAYLRRKDAVRATVSHALAGG